MNEHDELEDAGVPCLCLDCRAERAEDAAVRCRVCGCTDEYACEGGCSWVPWPDGDPICDRCDEEPSTIPISAIDDEHEP